MKDLNLEQFDLFSVLFFLTGFGMLFVVCFVLFLAFLKLASFWLKKKSKTRFLNFAPTDRKSPQFTVGFFHPFCNSGGGGERVLWSAVKVLQDAYPNCVCVIYTGDRDVKPEQIIKNANDRLAIELSPTRTKFVYLRLRFLVLDKYYPMFTLLGQSLGSMVLGVEAFLKFIPDIYFETTGYAFTYPLFHYLAAVPVCCYTHYPTISSDMLQRVQNQSHSYNNRRLISRSPFLTKLKLYYYKFFAYVYSVSGRCAVCVMVNSSWTQAHINYIWSLTYRTRIVYPPCDVRKFEPIFDSPKHDENFYIASVAQIRPEKNHQLQIKALAKFIEKVKQSEKHSVEKIKLFIIGSCRNQEDQDRAEWLKELCKQNGVENHVEFKLNFKFEYLLDYLSQSAVGIHTMIDEHFGIGVVECMASGLVMLSHNSAGPKMDIVVPYKGEKTGYLAETEDEYCDSLFAIYKMDSKKRNEIRRAASEHVKKFSQEQFNIDFLEAFDDLCFKAYFSKKDN